MYILRLYHLLTTRTQGRSKMVFRARHDNWNSTASKVTLGKEKTLAHLYLTWNPKWRFFWCCRGVCIFYVSYLLLNSSNTRSITRANIRTYRYSMERKYNHDYHLIDIFGYFWVCCTQTKTHNTHTRDAYDDDDVYGSSCGCKGAWFDMMINGFCFIQIFK